MCIRDSFLLVHISLHSNSQAAEGAGKGASEHGQHAFQTGQLGNGLDLVGVHHVAVHSTGLQGELLALILLRVGVQDTGGGDGIFLRDGDGGIALEGLAQGLQRGTLHSRCV